ncbi:MAG: undecaprenyl/decaprenyl-phosphate alpha-N-acetylglucosaminyl 1-phosphate transferase [Rhizobacter sp.]|nr:undecaprenyl/decaprenyl-phosphate alpha-N-acetylglucosaminyl 1-phosphate transferase [Bacteriovorax sp.]
MNSFLNTSKFISFTTPALILCALSSLGFLLLFWAKKTHNQSIRYFFYIPANKSKNQTLQLGGLPINLLFISTVIWLANKTSTTVQEETILFSSLVLYCGVLFYGYLDDRFEIRPIFKLAGQLFIALTYSLVTANTLHPFNSSVAFVFNFFMIMTTINGTNLLDGLDTMAFKIFAGTLGYFTILAMLISSTTLALYSISLLGILLPFYFLNRPPAKVYLGEIGAGSLAMSAITLSNLAFLTLTHTNQPLKASTYAVLPLLIPAMELIVSFVRRFLNKRSPFKGDRLHIHHILRDHYKFSSTQITNYYLFAQVCLCTLGFFMIFSVGSIMGVVATVMFLNLLLLKFGQKHWVTKDLMPINLNSLFQLSLKSKVKIISGAALNDFQIHLLDPSTQPPYEYEQEEKNQVS